MSQSNNIANKKSNTKSSAFETKFSFALASITLMLIFGYFYQSFKYIQEEEIIVIAIERIEAKIDNNEQQENGVDNRGSE